MCARRGQKEYKHVSVCAGDKGMCVCVRRGQRMKTCECVCVRAGDKGIQTCECVRRGQRNECVCGKSGRGRDGTREDEGVEKRGDVERHVAKGERNSSEMV